MVNISSHRDPETAERRSLARSAAAAAEALQNALTLLARIRVCAPYLIYFAFQILLMAVYLAANTGTAASFWALFIGGGDGAWFGHYPEHLLLMQPVLNRVEMLLDIVVRIVFHGATIVLVREALFGKSLSLRTGFSKALSRYPALLLLAIVSSALVFAAVSAGRVVSLGMAGWTGRVAAGAGIAAAIAIQALFVYTAPYVLIGGKSFAAAVASGIVLAWRLATKTLLIVAVSFVLVVPTTLLGIKAEFIALQLAPEFMIHLHVASKVMELISLYLVTAGTTVIFLKRPQRSAAAAVETVTD